MRNRISIFSWLCPFAAGLVLSPLASPQHSPLFGQALLPIPGPVDFKDLRVGFLEEEDGKPDLALLFNGRVHVLDAPAEKLFSNQAVPAGVVCFDVEARGHDGLEDRLVVSRNSRLEAWSWSAGSYGIDAVLASGRAYQDVRDLQIEVDAAGITSVYGRSGDRTLFAGVLNANQFTETVRFDAGGPVLAWRAVQWDGNGAREFAVQQAPGLMLRQADGTPLWASPLAGTSTNDLLASYHDPSLGSERVLWSTQLASGDFQVHVLDQRYPLVEPPLQLGTIEPGDLAAIEFSTTGATDLLVSVADGESALVFAHDGSASFPASSSFTSAWTGFDLGDGRPSTALLAVADIEGDGDEDLFAAVDDVGVAVVRGLLFDELSLMPVGPTQEGDVSFSQSVYHDPQTGASWSHTEFTFPVGLPLAGAPVDRVRVEAFLQPALGADLSSGVPVASTEVVFAPGESSKSAFLSWDVLVVNGEVVQFRLTPLSGTTQVGPPKIFYLSVYPPQQQALRNQLPFWPLDGGGGSAGYPGYPPQPAVGPCQSC